MPPNSCIFIGGVLLRSTSNAEISTSSTQKKATAGRRPILGAAGMATRDGVGLGRQFTVPRIPIRRSRTSFVGTAAGAYMNEP